MQELNNFTSEQAYQHIISHLEERNIYQSQDQEQWESFLERLKEEFPVLFSLLQNLYQSRYDFFYHVEELCIILWQAYYKRPATLKKLDKKREQNPTWYQSPQSSAAVCYLDRYAGTIKKFSEKIPYLEELGINILHLMPLFDTPEQENDGGYAISNYRKTHPKIGTIQELKALIKKLRKANISVALDFVFNHTADNHIWAKKARAGNQKYKDYYHIFEDRTMPDAYEKHLREIFPQEKHGNFTFLPKSNEWVWTTFHSYQWDLNFSNPAVFNAILGEMFFIANLGVEILRMDAVPFIWKKLGTTSENLPEVHLLLKAFNAAAKIVCPSLLFISEAIVHPNDVNTYIGEDKCKLSYNPLMMATSWESLATRETKLLQKSIETYNEIEPTCSWINYVRCHDDIGWTFSDDNAWEVGINPWGHRKFLNEFYTGEFPGSFSKGVPFQSNPNTGDQRICGTCASLAGLEKAINEEGQKEENLAIQRIALLHSLAITSKGIPLLYLGDELATLNNYNYKNTAKTKNDSRWIHRQKFDERRFNQRNDLETHAGQTSNHIKTMLTFRKNNPILALGDITMINTGKKSILAMKRTLKNKTVLTMYNFSEEPQLFSKSFFNLHLGTGIIKENYTNKILQPIYTIPPYQFAMIELND